MHWLASEVERLLALSETLMQPAGGSRVVRESGVNRLPEKSRAQFLGAVRGMVQEVARHPGVTACFACHDGLVLAGSGKGVDFEALSAMAQACLTVSKDAASALSLGRVQQFVLVGNEHKLALLAVGQLSIGILSPRDVELGVALSRGGTT
jgi:predicted regulator of Ras-like GTPase activity (Roadblock/LC7/MglB family)